MFFRVFSFSRVLRFKSRRANKAPATTPGAVPPPPPPKKRRGQSLRLEPVTSPVLQSLLSPIAQSQQLSPVPGTPGPIIVICQDPTQTYMVTEKVTSLSADTFHLAALEAPQKRVSFEDQRTESTSSAPSSRSTTPVNTIGVDQVSPKPTPLPHHSPSMASTETLVWEDVPEETTHTKRKGEKRPVSLFSPRPTRDKAQRFSVPAVPSRPDFLQRRASKRVSAMPPPSAKKEKRMSRWSQQINSAETQEVLRALRDMN